MANQSVFDRIPTLAAVKSALSALNDTATSFFDSLADVNLGERREQLQPIRIKTQRNQANYHDQQK